MKVYNSSEGILIEYDNKYFKISENWDSFINDDDVYLKTLARIKRLSPVPNAEELLKTKLLPPVGNQEIWAAGVTYLRSKSARMDESKDAGGGDFYDKVYAADRPELFFKCAGWRAVGPGKKVRIRKDSGWNVPEPELTLTITSSGKIIGYTIGNDMSSRDIEGQNPLYLPQAKTYDGSTAIGPCVLLTKKELPPSTKIGLDIMRNENVVFNGSVEINQIKRKFTELAEYLFRETSFPDGCLLMTGTGIVPPGKFTLQKNDVIKIRIDGIGELENSVD